MKAVICPVCNGTGVYANTPIKKGETTTVYSCNTCHGCGGKGWVEVQENSNVYVAQYPNGYYQWHLTPWYPQY